MKVLLIDDSRTMRSIEKAVVAQIGRAEVEEARDGAEALAKVRTFRPDLVLADWTMAGMDGLEFVRAFRRTDPATPVIMVITEVERARVIQAFSAGANNYIVKPFTPDLLSQRIAETMAESARAAA